MSVSPVAASGHPDDYKDYTAYLTDLQRLRAIVYLHDGAIQQSQIDNFGCFRLNGDEQCWHFLLLDAGQKVIGCARYLLHSSSVEFEDLRISNHPLLESSIWGGKLRSAIENELQLAREQRVGYAELGGWALAREYRNTRAALEILVGSYAWADMIGHCICSCTATTRNHSSSILRRVGGTPLSIHGEVIPPYFDEQYGCTMELLRFDSREVPQKFKLLIEQIKA